MLREGRLLSSIPDRLLRVDHRGGINTIGTLGRLEEAAVGEAGHRAPQMAGLAGADAGEAEPSTQLMGRDIIPTAPCICSVLKPFIKCFHSPVSRPTCSSLTGCQDRYTDSMFRGKT